MNETVKQTASTDIIPKLYSFKELTDIQYFNTRNANYPKKPEDNICIVEKKITYSHIRKLRLNIEHFRER